MPCKEAGSWADYNAQELKVGVRLGSECQDKKDCGGTARLTGGWTEGESPLEQRMSQFMHLRESCAGCREAVGEALTAARVGRALSIVNLVRSAEAVSTVEGNTGGPATGEGRSGSAVSKTSRHARTSSIGNSYVKGNAPESESQFGTGDDSSPAVAVALHGSGGESDPSCPRVGGRRRGLARPLRRAAGRTVRT